MSELIFLSSIGELNATLHGSIPNKKFFVIDRKVYELYPELNIGESSYVAKFCEKNKTLLSVEKICKKMLECGCGRDVTVVAVGGGVTGDVAGFAAATYMRGVDFVTVPTTLLSQVDSGVGGKTGVNLGGYKNTVGAFKMPSKVLICHEFLSTLKAREWRCGMGELIKTALLCGEIYDFVCGNIAELLRRDAAVVSEAVRLASAFKKKITDADPTERDVRAMLNLGHTVGHALEKCDNYKLGHGNYVLYGILIEMIMVGNEGSEFAAGARELIGRIGLTNLPNVGAEEVASAALSDKKNRDGKIRLIKGDSDAPVHYVEFSESEFTESYLGAVNYLIEKGELKRGS